MPKTMKSVFISLFILMIFSSCEEKAVPIDKAPSEILEKSPERGYIETH